MTQLGELIRSARKKAGLTQAELAKKLNVTQYTVSAWETAINFPKLEALQSISDITRFPFKELKAELVREKIQNMEQRAKSKTFFARKGTDDELRDSFAKAAMCEAIRKTSGALYNEKDIAEVSYRFADAMMKERLKNKILSEVQP